MDITRVTVDDRAAVEEVVHLGEAVDKVDSPWGHPETVASVTGWLVHGWDGDPPELFALRSGGRLVAAGEVGYSSYDNPDLAWLSVRVHPDHRRQGHGTRLFAALSDRAAELGRTSFGMGGWESAATRGFAERVGYRFVLSEINRRLDVDDVPDGFADLVARSRREEAGAYEFLTMTGPVPDELAEPMTVLWAAINDAPLDDLQMEPEVFPIERIRAYEHSQAGRGRRLHRVVARHRETGELAGHTIVAVEAERPHFGDQHDTSVVRAHRGHRLGIVLKGLLLEYLREVEPQVRSYDTWNAESNSYMIAVNDAMGFRVMGRALNFQNRGPGGS
ncbi:GNAT family N-acetyltransferase [Ornithinimicrobium sp. F0845]|uniref:GNAT family N-acetyltransferase n=1 Tax=Ornithinimicrobium sp. F0845 TaxID=2926412 RepID=UPI001FF177E2|nr:GNAT family N-acetyltransferase [Ornithinimicrobium sp. F0845]MCK0112925.1 GNAT family N-acetyltransferase [Ornithinimicrobium sp. F0845]